MLYDSTSINEHIFYSTDPTHPTIDLLSKARLSSVPLTRLG